MKCFVDGCHAGSEYRQGGFCARHWAMIRAPRRDAIVKAIADLRAARANALDDLTQPTRTEAR